MPARLRRVKSTSGENTKQKLPLTYYRSRSKTEASSSPFEKTPRKRQFRFGRLFSRGLDILLVVLIVACLIYSLIVRPPATVSVDSTIYHPISIYQQAVTKQLSNLKNTNKVTFNEVSIIRNLMAKFPEVGQVRIELPLFGQKPKVSLYIAQPAFWLSSGKQKFIIDNQGVASALAKNLLQISKLTTVEDQSGYQLAFGQQALSSKNVSFINSLIAQCRRAKVPLSSLILPAKAQEIDLRTLDRPYFVKFYLGGDPLLQTGQFLAARHHFDQTGFQPPTYLDVRVSGKVYSK